jgi:hypothetical protein
VTAAEKVAGLVYACLAAWWAAILWRQHQLAKASPAPTPSVCDELLCGCVLTLRKTEKFAGGHGSWRVSRTFFQGGERFELTVTRKEEAEDASNPLV